MNNMERSTVKQIIFAMRMAACLFAILGFAALEGLAAGTSVIACLVGAAAFFLFAENFAAQAATLERALRAKARRAKLRTAGKTPAAPTRTGFAA